MKINKETKLQTLDRDRVDVILHKFARAILDTEIGDRKVYELIVDYCDKNDIDRRVHNDELAKAHKSFIDQICQLILKEGIVITRGNIEYDAGIKIGGKYVDDKLIPIAGKKGKLIFIEEK